MKIDPYRLEAMKRLHLPTIMMDYGVVLKVTGRDSCMGLCPFHEDKETLSLSVGKKGDKWVWNCFGCKEHGNVVDFVMKKEDKPFSDVYQILDVKVDGPVPIDPTSPPATTTPVKSPAASSVPPSTYLARAVEIYHTAFCESRPPQDYLAGRGIKDGELFRHFKVGFADGRLRRMLPEEPGHEFVAGLRAAGVLNEKGGEFFYGCVTFPILNENGAVVGLYGRRAAGSGPAHLYLPGSRRGVWNGAAFKAHREIILTESIIDALSLCALGFTNAVPLYGVNGLTDDHLRLMREHRTAGAWVCLDNDAAGRKGREWIMAKLTALGVEAADVFLPDGVKDVNEALQKGLTADGFKGMMSSAKRAASLAVAVRTANGGTTAAIPAPVLPSSAPAAGPVVEEKDDAFFISLSGRVYRVKGLSARKTEHMKVNIKLDSGGEGHPDGSHLDTFDLYSSSAREKFVSCCRKIMKVEAGALHGDLNRLIEVLEGLQSKGKCGEGTNGANGTNVPPPPMTEEDAARATVALKRPSLLADILADMDTLGYVGEDHNKTLGYLVGISRKLESPLACVIVSQSSAGKSVLSETVERMTPPEDVVMYSRVTQYAIYYATKDGLKHKLLILEERAGSEEADYPIRSLQSKKRLTLAVPVKDPETNQMRMEERVVEGPVAYMETTTSPHIHDENATRCFLLFLDESEEQTRRIHERQRRAKTLAGFLTMGETDALVRRHHNMQRLLKAIAVVIPYADLIDFPVRWLRTRRDNMRFLNLIEVICFLYQHQRPVQKSIDGREYIEATVEDYAAAYSLAREIMGESFADLKKPQRELLKAIAALHPAGTAGPDEGVTRRAIREATGLADTRLRELLADLVSLEYVRELTGGGRGTTCRYTVLDHGPEGEKRLVGLTTPEELRKCLEAVRTSKVFPSEPVTDR